MRKAASSAKVVRALLVAAMVTALSVAVSGGAGVSGPAAGQAASPASEQYPVRGVYDRDIDRQAALGFNYIDSGAFIDHVDALAARGLKGFVWLGGYSNTTCRFNYSNDWVRSHVSDIAGHPGVGAYLIDDVPDADACPNAPNDIKARSDLVKSIDPGPPTFIVTYKVDQLDLFAGKTDIIGLSWYPCSIRNGCDYSKIDAIAAEADRLGIRYWGVIQGFGDDWYKVPTPDELHQQFVHWRATNMEGYLVYAWRSPDNQPEKWLANNPALQAILKQENGVPPTRTQYPVRGMYDRDIERQAALGFNFIDSGPYQDHVDTLEARGLKGFIWLGGYSNTTCRFNYTDDWVRSHVRAVAGHPAVGAYYIDDEPNAAACPTAPAQIKARSDLVKSIDPGRPTFIVTYHLDQLDSFAGKTDIIGLDWYPCSIRYGCDYSKIDAIAGEADRLGIRYWGVIQAHGDDWYIVPTPDELHQQFVHWRATNMEGYLVFAWRWPRDKPSMWLANNPALQAQLVVENGKP